MNETRERERWCHIHTPEVGKREPDRWTAIMGENGEFPLLIRAQTNKESQVPCASCISVYVCVTHVFLSSSLSHSLLGLHQYLLYFHLSTVRDSVCMWKMRLLDLNKLYYVIETLTGDFSDLKWRVYTCSCFALINRLKIIMAVQKY